MLYIVNNNEPVSIMRHTKSGKAANRPSNTKGGITMKINRIFTAGLLICSLLLSAGCGSDSTADISDSQAVQKAEHNVVNVAKSYADYAELADTLEELISESDFIAEVKVTDTSSYIWPDTDMIYTLLTPEVINVYKGTYNNELLNVGGGYMNYKEYANSPEVIKDFGRALDTSQYTEEELKTAEIYYDLCGNYIPEVGDKLIYFGIRDRNGDTDNYFITYTFQGLFLCNGDSVSNHGLEINGSGGFTEPLAKDLMQKFSGTQTSSLQSELSETLTVLNIPKNELVTVLENI